MSFKLQSKFVGRSETDQNASFDKSQQDGDENVIFCSSSLNLPTQSYKTAEYLGLRTGYSVYRQKSPKVVDQPKPKASKRKYDFQIFESESPVEPFSSLPHPNDLFGKRTRTESKKKRVQVNPVQHHSMQLHQKQAKLNMKTTEQQEKRVQGSMNHGVDIKKAHTNSIPQQDSSLQHTSITDFTNNSNKLFAHTFNNQINRKKTNQNEEIKSPIHFPFSFKTASKIFEE